MWVRAMRQPINVDKLCVRKLPMQMQNGMSRTYSYIFGIILILRGIAPFVAASFVNFQVFGLFQTGTSLAAVFAGSGIIALLLGSFQHGRFASWYLVAIGFIFGILGLLGFSNNDLITQLFSFSLNDNFLNAGVAITAMLAGFHIVVRRPDQFFHR